MNTVAFRLLASSISLLLTSTLVQAEETSRSDKHYVAILGTALEHRSIGTTNERAWGQVGTVVIGGHLTDLIHAEVRLGAGISDAEVPRGDLSLAVDYYASWYMGLKYAITDYANLYGQAGFTHVSGEASLSNTEATENRQFRRLEGDYPDSSFSISWLAGLDFEVVDDLFLVFEGGRLFEDTETGANTFQFSSGVRYEF
ncbi:MAG: outer membrane beta-barrel protein [Pseudomonadota bacterium]|nr:outer membrane beta-barrel protein [Pseudomonadota bacterium]